MSYKWPIRSKCDFSTVKLRSQRDWTNRILDENVLSQTALSPRLCWSSMDAALKRSTMYIRPEQTINWKTISGHLCGHTLLVMSQMTLRTLCINNRNLYNWYAICGAVKTKKQVKINDGQTPVHIYIYGKGRKYRTTLYELWHWHVWSTLWRSMGRYQTWFQYYHFLSLSKRTWQRRVGNCSDFHKVYESLQVMKW